MRRKETLIGSSRSESARDRLALIRYSHIVSSAMADLRRCAVRSADTAPFSSRQFDLLEFIAFGDREIAEAARFLGVSVASASASLRRLEQRWLAERSGDGETVRCTVEGRRVVASYRALQKEAMEKALESFGDEECREIARVLERWSLALMSIESDAGNGCLRCDGFHDPKCLLRRTRTCAVPRSAPHSKF